MPPSQCAQSPKKWKKLITFDRIGLEVWLRAFFEAPITLNCFHKKIFSQALSGGGGCMGVYDNLVMGEPN